MDEKEGGYGRGGVSGNGYHGNPHLHKYLLDIAFFHNPLDVHRWDILYRLVGFCRCVCNAMSVIVTTYQRPQIDPRRVFRKLHRLSW